MTEDTVDLAALLAELEERPSVTRELSIHGYHRHAEEFDHLTPYGSDRVTFERQHTGTSLQ